MTEFLADLAAAATAVVTIIGNGFELAMKPPINIGLAITLLMTGATFAVSFVTKRRKR